MTTGVDFDTSDIVALSNNHDSNSSSTDLSHSLKNMQFIEKSQSTMYNKDNTNNINSETASQDQIDPNFFASSNADLENNDLDVSSKYQDTISPSLAKDNYAIFNMKSTGPIKFHIAPNETNKNKLVQLIQSNGGQIVESNEIGYIISSHNYYSDKDYYNPNLIFDSIKNSKMLKTEMYKNVSANPNSNSANDSSNVSLATAVQLAANIVNNAKQNQSDKSDFDTMNIAKQAVDDSKSIGANKQKTTRKRSSSISSTTSSTNSKNGFTREEDMFILEEVRKNPSRRATHKLFGEISQNMGRHTGNSIRYRFRNHLNKQLQFVYKQDSAGNLLKDENGNYVKTFDMPLTVKNKFTSEDDYLLCKNVIERVSVSNSNLDSITLPNKFFDELEEQYPNHSKAAWRDRYRKFAKAYGITKYIEYYEACVNLGNSPNPMKDFTSRRNTLNGLFVKTRPTPGNLSYKLRSLQDDTNDNSAVENSSTFVGDDLSDVLSANNETSLTNASSNFDMPKNNSSLSTTASAITNNTINKRGRKKRKVSKTSKEEEDTSNLSTADVIAAATAATAASAKSKVESSDIDANNLFSASEEMKNEYSTLIDSMTHNSDNVAASSQIPLINRQSSSSISKLMDPILLETFFSKEFSNLLLSTVLDKSNEIVRRDYSEAGADGLLDALQSELGISRAFGTELLTNCCGDLSLVSKYLNLVINTGVHPPENARGIWTKEDDRKLANIENNKEDLDSLIDKHGMEGIDLRKQFIESTST